jgi:two-component system response regulator DevR
MILSGSISIIVVDDHPVVRHGLRAVTEIDPHIQIIGEAANAAEARQLVTTLQPQVVLLDVRLPDGSGLDLCREFKSLTPAIRALVLTSFADAQLLLDALAAGADGYLLKESDAHRIVNAIHTVCRGGTVFDPGSARRLVEAARRDPQPEARLHELTPGERRVLAGVASGQTDKEVAAQLGLQAKTVRNHLDRIFQKLGVHTRTQAALAYHRISDPNP